jgi:hypothetical protein
MAQCLSSEADPTDSLSAVVGLIVFNLRKRLFLPALLKFTFVVLVSGMLSPQFSRMHTEGV